MRDLRKLRMLVAVMAALALIASACGGDDDDGGGDDTTDDTTDDTGDNAGDDGGDDMADDGGDDMAVATGTGITEEPCPDAVNPDNGCIYLGSLSDLTEGPFAALGQEIVKGQAAFWNRVNEDGGIAGYDIDVTTYSRDNKYDPQEHVAQYRQIEPNILALAQTLGTPPTLAAVDLYDQNDVVAAPASWWSGWEFQDVILQSGYNYCLEAMNGLDYVSGTDDVVNDAGDQFFEGDIGTVMSVHYPGDYGGDSAAGVAYWAETNGVTFDEETHNVETLPNSVAGNQDGPVEDILTVQPDVVFITTGPLEMGEIVGKTVAQGFQGRFVGSVPTWNPALLQSEDLAPILPQVYRQVAPWGPLGSDTAAHDAMAEALGGELPANDGYTFGWIWQYPVLAVLQAAADNGDLTRAGVRAMVPEVTVDYEGALPDKSYSGDSNETVVRESLIAKPDPEAPLGNSVEYDFFVGPTAQDYDFTEPCISLG